MSNTISVQTSKGSQNASQITESGKRHVDCTSVSFSDVIKYSLFIFIVIDSFFILQFNKSLFYTLHQSLAASLSAELCLERSIKLITTRTYQ